MPRIAPDQLDVLGIPVEFILFALCSSALVLFHNHTLRVSRIGLAAITVYKIAFIWVRNGIGYNRFPITLESRVGTAH